MTTNKEEEGANCSICAEELLSAEACALLCGHVYHTACCRKWFQQRGNCPQCKQVSRADQLRVLAFEVAHVQRDAVVELAVARSIPAEARARVLDELVAESAELERLSVDVRQSTELNQSRAASSRDARKECDDNAKISKVELEKIVDEVCQLNETCAEVQVNLDFQSSRQARKFPVPRTKPDDADVREEKRKLGKFRLEQRTKQIHDGLVDARRYEAELQSSVREKEAAIREDEAALAKLRQNESRLSRTLRERRASQSDSLPLLARTLSRQRSVDAESLSERSLSQMSGASSQTRLSASGADSNAGDALLSICGRVDSASDLALPDAVDADSLLYEAPRAGGGGGASKLGVLSGRRGAGVAGLLGRPSGDAAKVPRLGAGSSGSVLALGSILRSPAPGPSQAKFAALLGRTRR